jgi:plasmid rolling circle replication initiator protein Rep
MIHKLAYLKPQSLQACQSLQQIESERSHALRQSRCAQFIQYAINPENGTEHLNRANWCGLKTCPVCTWLRSSKLRIRIFKGMPQLLADYPMAKFLLLTLTVKNCHFSQLRLQVRSMEQSWNRFHRSTVFPGMGFLKSLEITRPRDYFYYGRYIGRLGLSKAHQWYEQLQQLDSCNPQQWRSHPCEEVHPHLHCLLVVPDSYRKGHDSYLNHIQWRNLWRLSAHLDYDPIVDIRTVKRLNGGILEASKYCLKTNDMVDVIGCLTMRQLHGIRLTSIGGIFNQYFSQKAVDAIAQTGKLGNEHWQQGAPCHYQWVDDHYSMVRLANLQWQAA